MVRGEGRDRRDRRLQIPSYILPLTALCPLKILEVGEVICGGNRSGWLVVKDCRQEVVVQAVRVISW